MLDDRPPRAPAAAELAGPADGAAPTDSTSADEALVIEGVTKRFGSFTAVDDLSFRVPRGAIYGFLGQNGAGKTTTLRMVMSILYPDRGTLRVLGRPAEQVKDRLGYLPEEKGLYKKMTASEILIYFGRLKGLGAREAKRRATALLEELDLGDWIHRKCETLSKGMGQKVQVLATLIHEPDLVILDEPFSGLDPVNVEVLRELIRDLARRGRTVVFSTHIMDQAERLCDAVAIIHRGRKVVDGPLSAVKASGRRSILLDYDGDLAAALPLPGVVRSNDSGKQAELSLDPAADPQAVLARLVSTGVRVRRFDLREPSLHEVFVRAVRGPQAREVSRAEP